MTELKQKAEAEADKIIIGSGMDRESVIHLKHLLVTMYMQGSIENGIDWHNVADGDLPPDRYTVLSDKGTLVLIKDKKWYEYSPNYDNIPLKTWEEPKYWCEKLQLKEQV